MRRVSLLGVAAEAEALRLRRTAACTARRAAWAALAGCFAVAALVFVHAAALAALAPREGTAIACIIIAGCDLVLAGLLALLARQRHDPIAAEALALRRRVLATAVRQPVSEAIAIAAIASPAPALGALAGEVIAAWLRRR